ncbi:hypothetical protein [Nannocystis pusilla]|uniref:hypothetical protein n=1 Tax=Nannocystis pusilla TaxID=889268 RepID=UPI003B7CC861
MTRRSAAACVVTMLGVAACRQPPEVAFVTDRFEIAPEFEGELCGGNVAFMEARLAEIEELLGIEARGKIRYNWVEDISGFCPDSASACADGTTIYGPWSLFEHELVHAVAASMGQAKPFLAEGLAVAFSAPMLAPGSMMPSDWLDFDPLETQGVDDAYSYATAGHFVRFLYEEFGAEPLTRLYRMSEPDDSEAQLRGQFERVYG